MKKSILLLLFALACSKGFTQSSLRFSIGYGLPLNSDLIFEQYKETSYTSDAEIKGIYGSMGSGFTVNAAFGHTLGNEGLGWEIESTFLLGRKYKNSSMDYGPSNLKTYATQNSLCIQITPAITYSGTWKKLTPYFRIGPTIGINKIFVDVEQESSARLEYRYQYRGGISFGFKTAVGAAIEVSPKASFFWELSLVNMAYAPKEAWLTKYKINDEDVLSDLTDEQRTIKLEKKYTLDPDSDEQIQTRERHSMSAIALNLGFRFKLGDGK